MRGMVTFLHELVTQFLNQINTITVYISEAHSLEEWPIGSKEFGHYRQPQSLEERKEAAADFIRIFNYKLPLVIDSLENEFEKHYAPWPIRFYIVHHQKLKYIAEPVEGSFTLSKIVEVLRECLQ